MRLRVPGLLVVMVIALALAGQARAATTLPSLSAADILSQFNAVVTGNFTSTSDVEGRLAVGGNMTGGATFNLNPEATASAYGAVNVYGNVSSGNYNVNNAGKVDVKGTNSGTFNLNGGGSISTTALSNSNFTSTFATPLNALSSQLASLTANNTLPTVTNNTSNNVDIKATTVNSLGQAIFDVTAAQLEQFSSFYVDFGGSTTTTAIFNVSGNYTQNANFEKATDAIDSQVIWNFTNATSVSLNGFDGTVLAENAAVTNSSALNGDLYAASYNGNGELHDHPFTGTLPAASPAPMRPLGHSLAGLAMLGVVGGLGVARRRRDDA
jgi:choice-of-anchor A domain-containing protein